MAWIAIDCDLPDHPKMAHLSDGARWAYIVTLARAKRQRRPGVFDSETHYRMVLGRLGRYMPDLQKQGLLDTGEDGSITVHDWQKHQWAAAKSRQREDIPETNEGQKEDSRARSALSLSIVPVQRNGEGVQGEDKPDAVAAYYLLQGKYPSPKVQKWLDELAAEFGHEALTRALAQASEEGTTSGLIGRARDIASLERRERQQNPAPPDDPPSVGDPAEGRRAWEALQHKFGAKRGGMAKVGEALS